MFNVAVVGATGAVGGTILRVLEERGFPVTELRPLASARSAGIELDYLGRPRTVRTLTGDAFDGIQIALFSAGASRSLQFAPAAVEAGAVVIDNSSAYRMDPRVPLVVPEVNEADLEGHAGIVANPNCVAAPLVVALKPIADAVGLERVIVSSYQSVSGTGQAAVTELREQSAGYLAGDEPEPAVYPHPIAFNAMPHVGDFGEDGYTGEEQKVADETRKMLGLPDLPVSATCVRVPVLYAHSQAVHIETSERITADAARNLLMVAPGVVLVDEPALSRYPLARDATGRDEVFVGRIREDSSHPQGAGAVGRERQPAQGRRDQRGPDRRVAGHPGLALNAQTGPDPSWGRPWGTAPPDACPPAAPPQAAHATARSPQAAARSQPQAPARRHPRAPDATDQHAAARCATDTQDDDPRLQHSLHTAGILPNTPTKTTPSEPR